MSYDSLETTGLTKVVKKKFSYKWVIKNFSTDIVQEPGDRIASSNFSSDSNKEDEWCIELYPKGLSDQNEGNIYIYLSLVSTTLGKEKVKYSISIIDSIDSTDIKLIEDSKTFILTDCLSRIAFVRRNELFEKESKFLPSGTLTIICNVEKVVGTVATTNRMPIQIPNSTMRKELGLIIQNETFGDVLLKIGENKFRASKTILAARSPVFAGMFSHENMKENQKNEVDITDMNEDVLRELLYFIYTDTAPNINEMPEELLAAADKYQLDRLKIMCEKALYEKISIDNVAEIFVLSELYNAGKLKNGALKFMKGRERELFKTNGFKSLQDSDNHQAWNLYEMLLIEGDMSTLKILPRIW